MHISTRSELVGKKFGRWLITELVQKDKCIAICDCGEIRIVRQSYLRNGRSKSCGCLQKELTSARYKGHTLYPEYPVWRSMRARCNLQSDTNFLRYGGRGIKVCSRWDHGENGLTGFECFIADLGRRPTPKHSIERKNNNGNYEPSNCEWATKYFQSRNVRNNHHVFFNGERMILADAARLAGIDGKVVANRLSRGWDIDRALSTPQDAYDKNRCINIDVNGVLMNLKQAAKAVGIKYGTLYARIKKGIPPEQALIP